MNVLLGILIIFGLLLVAGVLLYNSLVTKRNRVANSWSQIDVQLKRRHDLIPNLVNAVKGYMSHEKEVLSQVTAARTRALAAGNDVTSRAEAENLLSQSLHGLFALAEAYPELKADGNMLALQEELTTTENRIAFARQAFNDNVMVFNTACQSFPNNLLASAFHFTPATFFEDITAAEKMPSPVRFD